MTILVCGSRNWTDERAIRAELTAFRYMDVTLVHGDCPTGADRIADKVGVEFGFDVRAYPADWKKHGKAAGPIRNSQMLKDERPHVVFAFHEHVEGSGTEDMLKKARRAGVGCYLNGVVYCGK